MTTRTTCSQAPEASPPLSPPRPPTPPLTSTPLGLPPRPPSASHEVHGTRPPNFPPHLSECSFFLPLPALLSQCLPRLDRTLTPPILLTSKPAGNKGHRDSHDSEATCCDGTRKEKWRRGNESAGDGCAWEAHLSRRGTEQCLRPSVSQLSLPFSPPPPFSQEPATGSTGSQPSRLSTRQPSLPRGRAPRRRRSRPRLRGAGRSIGGG